MLIALAATSDISRIFIELGAAIVGLAVLGRLASRWGFSAIPLYLLAGLAVGNGGGLARQRNQHICPPRAREGGGAAAAQRQPGIRPPRRRDRRGPAAVHARLGVHGGGAGSEPAHRPAVRGGGLRAQLLSRLRRPVAAGVGADGRRAAGRGDLDLLLRRDRQGAGGARAA